MTDAFFGAGQTTWTPLMSPGFGWATPMAAGNLGIPNLPPIASVPGAAIPVVTPGSVVAALAMRRGQPAGPTSDADIEDFLCDALELIPGTSEAEVRCDGGRVTLSGSVPHKRQKHDVGAIAWAIPSVTDVQNTLTIAARRRARGVSREAETPVTGPVRKNG